MNRYINSFLITVILYISVGFFIFYSLKDEKILYKEVQKTTIISLNEINFSEPKKIIEKDIIETKEIKKISTKKINENITEKSKTIQKKFTKIKEEHKIVKPKQKLNNEILKKDILTKTPQKKEAKIIDEKDIKQKYIDDHLALIINLIKKNVIYPKIARQRNIQDTVIVKFTILKNGELTNIEILKGHKFLQKTTIKALKKASEKFPSVPKVIDLKLPIEYKLI